MAMGKRRWHAKHAAMWVAIQDLPRTAAHPFYTRLNQILDRHDFDGCVERLGQRFYADDRRPGLRPGAVPASETHEAVFTWMLQRLADAGLVRGKTVGIDSTTPKQTPRCAASCGATRARATRISSIWGGAERTLAGPLR
jgi:hypothetical protein